MKTRRPVTQSHVQHNVAPREVVDYETAGAGYMLPRREVPSHDAPFGATSIRPFRVTVAPPQFTAEASKFGLPSLLQDKYYGSLLIPRAAPAPAPITGVVAPYTARSTEVAPGEYVQQAPVVQVGDTRGLMQIGGMLRSRGRPQ